MRRNKVLRIADKSSFALTRLLNSNNNGSRPTRHSDRSRSQTLRARTSALTAIGNDYGFDRVFERQLRALGKTGDVFIGISTSGKSPNLLAAFKAAREMGIVCVGFTRATDTPMHALCDLTLGVPAAETSLIQQVHITAAHAICALVERDLFGI